MLTAGTQRSMQQHGTGVLGFIGGAIGAAAEMLAIGDPFNVSQEPLVMQVVVFILVTFLGGIIGTFGKDFYNRFMKLTPKEKDDEHLNGPGTALSAAHHRPLWSGEEYERLIPPAQGGRIQKESGDTSTTLEIMDETARTYQSEARQLAVKLKGTSRKETVENIKQFLYNHFQYLADTDYQLIRTLARAWRDREAGIDCKSYSVIASQILLELGIPHYFARIKQKGDGSSPSNYSSQWSHVFVVVPKTGDAITKNSNSFWALDGVPKYNHVPEYTQIDFYPMLNHAVLNGPTPMGCLKPSAALPENPIVTRAEKSIDRGLPVYEVEFTDQIEPTQKAVVELNEHQMMRLKREGCPMTQEVLNGLGESDGGGDGAWIQALIQFGASLIQFLGPSMSGAEEQRVNELRTRVKSSGWPHLSNTSSFGWNNHETASDAILTQLISKAETDIRDLQAKIRNEEYESSGELRVWNRYLLVWAEGLTEMSSTYADRGLSTDGGSSGGGPSIQVPGQPNSQGGVTMAGFGKSALGWLLLIGAGVGLTMAVKNADNGSKVKTKV